MQERIDFSALPVVGREGIQQKLLSGLQNALDGQGGTLLLRGGRGTGKTHLCRYLHNEAEKRGLSLATARAYRAESGVPYSLFSDAFLPLLRAQPKESLMVLSRGGAPDLEHLFPGLTQGWDDGPTEEVDSPGDLRLRVLWTFTGVVTGLAARNPLCVILEDLQWADESSLEVIHFLARHLLNASIFLVLTLDEVAGRENDSLVELERSLLNQGVAEGGSLAPFSRADTGVFLKRGFGLEEDTAEDFIDHLHYWTQGNPFFLQETLQGLIRTGALYKKGGSWLGWEVRSTDLPRTVRDAVLDHISAIPEEARSLAELAAALGVRAPFNLLRILSPLPETELLENLKTLVEGEILVEGIGDNGVVYDFRQNLVKETLLKEVGLASSQILHDRIARRLEEEFGDEAPEHADTLAFHYFRATGEDTPSAILFLAQAGRNALARFGNAEAAEYLRAANSLLERREARGEPPVPIPGGRLKVIVDLARTLSRVGEYTEAIPLWEEAEALAEKEGDPNEAAECRRRIGIIRAYQGNPRAAVEEFDSILNSDNDALSPVLLIRTRLRRGVALEELGALEEAREEMENVLDLAEELNDPVTLAQAHRALVLLHIWTGHPNRVRAHSDRAMELARSSGALGVEFWTHWGLAVLDGLLGNTEAMAKRVAEADRVAKELRSPVLGLRSTELAIELAAASGEWDSGIIIGEQAIALARSLSQNTILPRILVWTALIYLGRGEIDLAEPLIEEAWEVSGAGDGRSPNVHGAIPAHIGKGYLALRRGNFEEAVAIGEAALEMAEGVGYGLWTIHRLGPLLGEAYLELRDLEQAKRMGLRLRKGSTGIQHKLGVAWADSCDALVTWLEGDPKLGAELMGKAAQALEEVPMIGDATRLRRLKAGRLAEIGDRKGALEELARVHEIFLLLGAEKELEATRNQFRELDARPPRKAATGGGGLSAREVEIALLVEERKSNKAIARALNISPRTVSTHLSNIYQKLGITSRGELADYVRTEGLSEA